jgi:hypothetical protein
MDDRRRRRIGGQPFAHPRRKSVHFRNRRRLRSLPAFGPSAHLALHEAGRLAEAAQAVRGDVDGVQLRQGVDHGLAEPPARVGLVRQLRRLFGPHHHPRPALHRIEHRSDDGGVVAQQVRTRSEREHAVHRRQPPELARHVVRGGGDRPERWPPDDDFGVAEPNEVRQVRVAAGKLRYRRLARHIDRIDSARGQMFPQPADEPGPIQLLAASDGAGIVFHGAKLSCAWRKNAVRRIAESP